MSEVILYVGLIQNLKDLKVELVDAQPKGPFNNAMGLQPTWGLVCM